MKTSKLKKRMSSGSCLTSKLYDKIIKMPSKSHEKGQGVPPLHRSKLAID
jgi:hypothetical protein